MTTTESILLKNEEATAQFAQELALRVPFGITIALLGTLGAGKTTFVRYFMRALGFEEEISSPTYVLQNEYLLKDGRVVEHWDLYRLKGGIEELEEAPRENCLRIVEWACRDQEFLDSVDACLEFLIEEDGSRRVLFRGWGE